MIVTPISNVLSLLLTFLLLLKELYCKASETESNFFRIYSINNSNYFPKIEVKILKRARVIWKKAFLFKSFINHQRVIISVRRKFSWQTASQGDHASSQLCSHLLLKAVFFQSRRSLVLGMNLQNTEWSRSESHSERFEFRVKFQNLE